MRWLQCIGLILVGCLPEPPSGDGEGQTDGSGPCVPAEEVCNELDDDCDGRIDEAFALTAAEHCGSCNNDCTALPDVTQVACVDGACAILVNGCEARHCDRDLDATNGCEAYCSGTGTEEAPECNDIDDDCDCKVDEGLGLETDVNHCGQCGIRCVGGLHDQVTCLEGGCVLAACDVGWFNPDGLQETGCHCLLPDNPMEVPRLRSGDPPPENRHVAFLGDGTPGLVAWGTEEGQGEARRLTLNVRPQDAEGYWQGPVTQPLFVEGANVRLDTLLTVAPGRYGVVFRNDDVLSARILGEAATSEVAEDCGNQNCFLKGIDGEVVGLHWIREGEAPEVVQRLVTSAGQELSRRELEEAAGFDPISAFACRARDACAALFNRGGTLRIGVNGSDTELEAAQTRPNLQALAYGPEGLVAIWRRSRDGEEETVAAVVSDDGQTAGQIVRGPAVIPVPGDADKVTIIPDGPAGFVLFYDRSGSAIALHLRPDGSATGDGPVAFPFYPRPGIAATVLYDDAGHIARLDRTLSQGLPWPRPAAGLAAVPTEPAGAEGTPPGPVAWRGQEAVFLEAPEGEGEPMLFTLPDGPEPTALVPWLDGTVAVAVGRTGLRVAWVPLGSLPLRAERPWQLSGEAVRLDVPVALTLVRLGDRAMAAVTGRAGDQPVLAIVSMADPAETTPIALMPLEGIESNPRLAAGDADSSYLLTAVDKGATSELRLRRLGFDGQIIEQLADTGRNANPGRHDLVRSASDTFVVWLDGAMNSPSCAGSMRFIRCTEAGCRTETPGIAGRAGTPGVDELPLPEGEGCYTQLRAVPNAAGGLTAIVGAQGQSRLWFLNFDDELRLLGAPSPWPLSGEPESLSLTPSLNGAHATYWRGSVLSSWLGCP